MPPHLRISDSQLSKQLQAPRANFRSSLFRLPPNLGVANTDSVNVENETRAKNPLKAELKRRGITYAGLAENLGEIGVVENERNLNNKISRGGFTAAFLLQCMAVIGITDLKLV